MRWLALLLLLPLASAQAPGLDDVRNDGIPFELDTPRTVERLEAFVDDVSGQAVHDCVDDVTTNVPYSYRLMGTPTQSAFLSQYETVFSDMGLPSAFHEFSEGAAGIGPANTGLVLGEGGTNLLAVLPGLDLTKWVVIGGHYDTREATMGALDNASGICTVLEIARAMKEDVDANGPYEASVVFAWYDGEEWGLYGAIAFSEDTSVAKELLGLAPETPVDILVSQSFDMPGINWPAKNIWLQYPEDTTPSLDFEKVAVLNLRTAPIHNENEWACWSYGCYVDLKQRADFNQTLRNFTNYQFLVREVAYDLMQTPPDLVWVYDDHYGRSDHIPLIAKGAAGMRIQGSHDEEYPCYHQPCDTLPWLYQQTGDSTGGLLIQAYDTEADIGGAVAMYAALMGDHGRYGDHLWFGENVAPRPSEQPAEGSASEDAPLPVVLLIGALLLAMLRRGDSDS